eukprot:6638464-Pyramimonas_sp.AAC.1
MPAAFFFSRACNLASWNSGTFFGAVSGSESRQRRAQGKARWLYQNSDVVFLQETHGSEADLSSLERDFHDFVHFCSLLPSNAGGVVISIRKTLVV